LHCAGCLPPPQAISGEGAWKKREAGREEKRERDREGRTPRDRETGQRATVIFASSHCPPQHHLAQLLKRSEAIRLRKAIHLNNRQPQFSGLLESTDIISLVGLRLPEGFLIKSHFFKTSNPSFSAFKLSRVRFPERDRA
jgi:hypothetical protein